MKAWEEFKEYRTERKQIKEALSFDNRSFY